MQSLVGLYYSADPTYQNHKEPFIYNINNTYQVLVPDEDWFRIAAVCESLELAQVVLSTIK